MGAALRELEAVKQTPGEPRLRWLQSDYFDLFLWQNEADTLCRLQLCYDRGQEEHALTWVRDTGGITHHSIDSGEWPYSYNASPMLCAAKNAPPTDLAERFQAASKPLSDEIREQVLRVIAGAR